MKILEILNERNLFENSTLSALGVDNQYVGKIHRQLRLKHDTEWTQIKTKTQAKEALKGNQAVVAITADNKAYAFGHYSHPMSGGQQVIFFDPDDGSWANVNSLTKALARVKGKAKYFISVKGGQHMDKSARRYEPGPNDDKANLFLDKANQVYGNLIKAEARKAYKAVRNHMHDLLDDEVEIDNSMRNYTPSHHDLNEVKAEMKYLKAMSEKGLKFWNENSRFGDKGEYAALADFLGGGYKHELNGALSRFEENQKLALQKFIKYVLKEISNVAERAVTGGFEEHGKSAKDWDTK